MSTPLPLPYTQVMLNGWAIIGQFMYPPEAFRRLLELVRAGGDDAARLPVSLPEAMDAAAGAGNLDYVVIRP